MFGDPNDISVLSSTRTFVCEEACNVLSRGAEKSVIVYFMSDSLLITERID